MELSEFHPNIEVKYTYPVGLVDVIRGALEAVCVRDPEHPRGQVNSVYFDTLDRVHLAEKVNSDYIKTKIRLRWYSAPEDIDPNCMVPAFLEVKSKQGTFRSKSRIGVEFCARTLRQGVESFEELTTLANQARECGYIPRGPLFPMIMIHYQRYRFCEPESSARVSLDSGITYTWVNRHFFSETGPRTLRHGVLEVKSATGDLPRSFFALRPFVNKRDSFSKYEECWQLHADPFYRREVG